MKNYETIDSYLTNERERYLKDRVFVNAVSNMIEYKGLRINDDFRQGDLGEKVRLLSIMYTRIKVREGSASVEDCSPQRVSKVLRSAYEGATKRVKKYEAAERKVKDDAAKEQWSAIAENMKQGSLF